MGYFTALTGMAIGFGFVSWRLLERKAVDPRLCSAAWAGLLIAVGVTASVVSSNAGSNASRTELRASGALDSLSLQSLAWPPTQSAPRRTTASAAMPEAAPVASLIAKLELRLSEHPDDVKGWVLLAQSHAFTGNEEAAEHAVRRAVALGFDEQALRERVRLARRDAEPVNWIEQAIGG